ncbi:MAG: NAD-dependent epimerase/dehydratase family protein [Primorskyibacter sp.]
MAGITQDNTGIVVLGASGRVGRMICDLALKVGPKVAHMTERSVPHIIPVVRHTPHGHASSEQIQWRPTDPIPDGLRAAAVIAAWGVTTATNMGHAVNVQLARDAVALAHAIGARRVVHCSSAAVYGAPVDPKQGASETTPPAPLIPYGQSKLEMEQAIPAQDASVDGSNVTSVFLRIGNVAGADRLAASGRSGQVISLDQFPDGRGPRRSYIGPKALVRVMLWAAMARDVPRIVNVSAPHPIGMEDLAHAMGWPITWRPAPDTAIPEVALDTRLLQRLCPLSKESSNPEVIARELHAGGWHK